MTLRTEELFAENYGSRKDAKFYFLWAFAFCVRCFGYPTLQSGLHKASYELTCSFAYHTPSDSEGSHDYLETLARSGIRGGA